jgi:hypothetical protein
MSLISQRPTSRCPGSSTTQHPLRVPVGKLHNDRLVPLHPQIVELLAHWVAREPANDLGLLLHRHGRRLDRHIVTRILNRVAKAAGIGHVSPHQLRHTLATQAINRGMRRRIREEQQRRLLGNGYCGRPVELDCSFESICESCVHFQTGPEFVPVLLRQRDHADQRDQTGRRDLFDQILTVIQPQLA